MIANVIASHGLRWTLLTLGSFLCAACHTTARPTGNDWRMSPPDTPPLATPPLALPARVVEQDPQNVAPPPTTRRNWLERAYDTVAADHVEFYDQGTLLALGAGVGLAAISANSQLDRDIYEDILPEWRTGKVDGFRDDVVWMGDGAVMLPVFGAAALLAPTLGSDAIGSWGERCLRATLVGAPSVLALQRLTGAGRPDDPNNRYASEWQPLEFSNGVSGHAFIGSIPFLTVAGMQDDPWLDGVCFVASTAVAAARLQGSRHYFSQVVLGWWIGWLSVEAIEDSEAGRTRSFAVVPHVEPDGFGITFVHRF